MPTKSRLLVSSALLLFVGGCATPGAPSKMVEFRPSNASGQPEARPDEALYQAAVTAIGRRDYALALDALQAARSRSPDDPRVWNAMGVVYDKLGRFDLSARYYAQAQELDPGSRVIAENQAYSAVLQRNQAEPRALAAMVQTDVMGAPPAAAPAPAARAELVAPLSPSARPVVAAAPVLRTAAQLPAHEPAARFAAVTEPLARWAAPPMEAFVDEPSLSPAAPALAATAADPVRRVEIGSVPLTATPPRETPEAPMVRPVVAAAPTPMLVSRASAVRRAEIRSVALTVPPPAIVPAPVESAGRPLAPPRDEPSVASRRIVVVSKSTSVMRLAIAPADARVAVARKSASALIGRPLLLVNASGRRGGAEPVRLKLASRGWSAPGAVVRLGDFRAVSTIRYASRNVVVARALARTLPYRVRLESCGATCRGVTLYVGADALRWNRARLAAPAYRARA